jgi:hypothetical protein
MKKITATGNAMIIDVRHECANGWHEFTSPQVPGLYIVAEQDDLEAAYEDVPVVLALLIEADTGRKVTVKREPSYEEYVDALPESYRPSIRHYSVEKLAA